MAITDYYLPDGGGDTTTTTDTSTNTSTGTTGKVVKELVPLGDGTYQVVYTDGTLGSIVGQKTSTVTYTATDGTKFTDQLAYASYQANLDAGVREEKSQVFQYNQQKASQEFSSNMYNQQVNYAETLARQSAFDVLMAEFSKYGLGSLVEPLRSMLTEGVSPGEFAVRLRQTDAYKQRFIANEARIANGLRALGPAEYLANEDAYRQTLRAYGLTAFDNDAYVRKFLENDMSPAELNTRVVDAVQRVQMADPSIKNTIKQYYGLSDTELTAYILDPKNQLPQIERKIQAGEIGGAAFTQGLSVSATTAEDLAAYGVTQNQARQGYQAIGEMLPSATKLSEIYGSTMDTYGQSQAEEEVFKGTASAKRARERLIGREIGTFTGQSGVSRSSLESSGRGNF